MFFIQGERLLQRFWNNLGITRKFSLTFSVILSFILISCLFSYMLLSTVHRQTVSDIEKSFNIQKLVFEMDRDIEKTRRMKHEFSLHYINGHSIVLNDDFTSHIYTQLDRVKKHSESLKNLISCSSVSNALQQKHININLYYSIASRCDTVFRELVELVEQLVGRQKGLQKQLEEKALLLKNLIEESGEHTLLTEFNRMRINVKDYLFTRQRPFMQSALNSAFLLERDILDPGLTHEFQKASLLALVTEYSSIAKKIPELDIMIQTKSNDFDLNTETLEPISADLVSLARQEVETSRRRNQYTVNTIGILLFISGLCGFALVVFFALVIQKSITGNIVRLTNQAALFQSGNFEIHDRLKNNDELGRLSEVFNEMSFRIKELINGLEDQVQERTKDLVASNASLKKEMAERKIAEKAKLKLEADLRQSHKMEAIGTLAGGIAHDFNNILGIIMGNSELAMDDIPHAHPARKNLQEIFTATLRAKEIVKQLLSFSRKTEQEKQIVSLQVLVKETIKLIRATIPSTIEIRQNLAMESGYVNADPVQIHQLLINLCTNAAHAMEQNGGVMEISLSEFFLDEVATLQFSTLKPGPYVQLTISDTGIGIKADIVDKIFDPYFTTKKMGRGTGMGLAIVHGIIKNHEGHISVYSEPGKGSVFKILLPDIKKVDQKDTPEPDILRGGHETILLVDDEKSIVEVGRKILSRLGYVVYGRTDPETALQDFCADSDKYDLVITDMTMPGMTGDELARKILEIRPEKPIILCTGFSKKINMEQAMDIGIRYYIEKPLNRYELAITVRAVLDEG